MEKKYIAIICIVIVLFAAIVVCFNEFHVNNVDTYKMKIGGAVFDIPNGFHTVNVSDNFVKLNDGDHSIFIEALPNNDINHYANEYKSNLTDINSSSSSSNPVVNGISTKKVISNKTGATHYWFEYNNKAYTIYTWAPFDEMDSITEDLIKSIH